MLLLFVSIKLAISLRQSKSKLEGESFGTMISGKRRLGNAVGVILSYLLERSMSKPETLRSVVVLPKGSHREEGGLAVVQGPRVKGHLHVLERERQVRELTCLTSRAPGQVARGHGLSLLGIQLLLLGPSLSAVKDHLHV